MSKFRPMSMSLEKAKSEHLVSSTAGASAAPAVGSFEDEEKQAFSEHINNLLEGDPLLARHLPMNPESNDLFTKVNDGLILCQLINAAVYESIDERSINKKEGMNVYQKTENQNLALNAAKSIGCQVINIGAADIIDGRPILILGLVWQIIKIQLLSMISLNECPELVVLLEEGETLSSFTKLSPELILLRWLNYHLQKAGSDRHVTNFGSDLQDSEVYNIVLHRLDATKCPLIHNENLMAKAGCVINNSRALGVSVFIKPKDICDGNKKLNISMVAQIFNTCHGLTVEEDRPLPDLSTLEIDDAGDTREERVFRMWINSLNIDGLYCNNLFGDCADGVMLLRVMDAVQPGSVVWRRVNLNPSSRFKVVENCNYVVTIAKDFGFSMVNVGGLDIVDGNKKLMLAIMWQLMRKYTLQVLAVLAKSQGITNMNDDEIVKWANAKVTASGKKTKMRNFKDSGLKTSHFFLELVAAIEPRAVDFAMMNPGETEEQRMLNAKYCISNARKVGACVFLTPEDICEVKSKMLLTFVAGLWHAELTRGTA